MVTKTGFQNKQPSKSPRKADSRVSKGRGKGRPARSPSRGATGRAGAGFPIVGIGASAGGLEAVTAFVKELKSAPGMAFVLVQHLDPAHESMLHKLLAKSTVMPVAEVEQGMTVERDHFYVIPPNMSMIVRRGALQVTTRQRTEGKFMPIDQFFTSLAEDQKSRAVGVILSGTATDGTLGLQAIKAEGGTTFAQDRRSAKYPGMPESAVAAGCVDFVLPPGEMARKLCRMAKFPPAGKAAAQPEVELPLEGGTDFQRILALTKAATGVDFSLYKPGTIKRRIARRMALKKLDDLGKYARYLRNHGEEAKALYQDILIHVTGFFREPGTYEALRNTVFAKLVAGRKPGETIRVWVPGCSTGEEVYSVAMTLLECLDRRTPEIPIQIFGTDISVAAIDKARAGIYPESSVAGIHGERLHRFFVPVDGGHQVSKVVREMCVFARHDLAIDPPFSKLDLISCRNVLIYLGPILQKRVMAVFHYALKPGGFLVLGKSEALSAHSDLFELEDDKGKVYSRKEARVAPMLELAALEYGERPAPARRAHFKVEAAFDLQKAAERILWQRYSPAAFLVDADAQVLHFQGDTSRYLAPAPGAATLNLMRLVREELVLELRTLIHKVKKEGDVPARKEGVLLLDNGHSRQVNLEVIPIRGRHPRGSDFLIVIEEIPPLVKAKPEGTQGTARQGRTARSEAARIKNELAATREHLQSIIEDQEATNEELKAANEEILSSNEELQSTNEEMETAKEELQSGNEELTTLNEELQNRNAELNHLANDLSNLLVGVNIPIVILGADHRIRRFTPMAEKLLNLIPTDIGRPISDIKPNIDVPDLEAMIASSVRDVRSLEREVQDHDGRWYSLRMRPYRTSENTIEGVLMALVDIDAVKRSRDQVAAERDFSTTLLDMVGALVVVTDGDRKVLVFNRACQEATGYALEEVRGKRPNDFLVPPEEVHIPDAAHAELLRGAKKVRSETHWARKDGARRLISWTGTIMDSSDHLRRYIISAGIDITEQRAAEGRQRELTVALGESQEEYRALAASLLRVQEEERSRIAGELHDEFNQRLAALAIQISSLERGLPDASQDFLRRELRAAEDGLRSLSNGIHELARQIHPSMVELLGLTPALESLCAGTSRQDGMRVRFSHRSVPRIIPREIALCLYRVAQEALRNAAKHSGAHEAKVWVTGSGQAIGLSISDAGAGFDPAAARRAGGLGLIIMEERVRLSGGKLTVRSRRGEGTEISVKVPLPDQEEG